MRKPVARICALLALLLAAPGPAALIPDDPASEDARPPRPGDALGSPVAVAAWAEGVVRTQLADHGIPGAAIAIVDTQGPLLVAGYGYADLAERRPVDPERSLFRIASITKTFTWATVMRLVLDGRLDLNTDVNEHTELVEVPMTNGRPVTLADLMTHSAGFEERGIGLLSRDAAGAADLDGWLAANRPAVVYAPGRVPAYSNYGTALAGSIAANVAGRSWADLVEEGILDPLGMTHTYTRQPLPADVAADFAPGHQRDAGALRPTRFEFMNGAPAGAMTATAADMARWLEAHLTDGRVAGEQRLDPALVEAMTRPLRRFHPELPPVLHGFYRMDHGGEVIHGHHGDINDTQSVFAVFPERGIGVFAVYNRYGGRAGTRFVEAVVERLQGGALPDVLTPPGDFSVRAGRYAGEYAATRRNHSTLEKAALLGGTLQVSASADGHLVLRWPDGNERQWVEVAPDEFRARDGTATLRFDATDDGDLRLWSDAWPLGAYEQQTGLAAPSVHRLLLVLVATAFVLALFGYPAASMRSGERMVFGAVPKLPAATLTLVWLTSALGLVVLCILFVGLGDPNAFLYEVPPFARIAVWLAAAFGLLSLVSGLLGLRVLVGDVGTFGQRARLGTVACAGLLLTLLLVYWNLVPWGLP